LGNTAAVDRYEGMLKVITDRGNVSRAQVESFYRQNIGAYVAEIVDAGFKEVSIPVQTATYIKQTLTSFYSQPSQSNYTLLKNIYMSFGTVQYVATRENMMQAAIVNAQAYESQVMQKAADAARESARSIQNA
jgi:hypothetical protein